MECSREANAPSKDIGERSSNPEGLLSQSELLAVVRAVVGVEDSRDRLGLARRCDRSLIVAGVEGYKIEATDRTSRPETDVGRGLSPMSWNRRVICHGEDLANQTDV